eukprot:TRINITY_DN11921_c0_g1_i1.p1 TRINITY_DN11921_c0_g1~~TRINITY_DN11921_c0_g1_i1.p1  ORF type:complete len:170 (-),score=13.83 TRINITY_DN11921_c0_g1_i1:78-587(-)
MSQRFSKRRRGEAPPTVQFDLRNTRKPREPKEPKPAKEPELYVPPPLVASPDLPTASTPAAVPEHPFKLKAAIQIDRRKRHWKSLRQTIAMENPSSLPLTTPHYSAIDAGPSLLPPKKYCDITGLPAKYTDPETRLQYATVESFETIKTLPSLVANTILQMRGAGLSMR